MLLAAFLFLHVSFFYSFILGGIQMTFLNGFHKIQKLLQRKSKTWELEIQCSQAEEKTELLSTLAFGQRNQTSQLPLQTTTQEKPCRKTHKHSDGD